jgi:hypothetical protein
VTFNYNPLPGERFIITNIQAYSNGPSSGEVANLVVLTIFTGNGTVIDRVAVPLQAFAASPSSWVSQGNQFESVYFDPGTFMKVDLERAQITDNVNVSLHISGYRVTYP